MTPTSPPGSREVDVDEFAAGRSDAFVLDVREVYEHEQVRLPDATLIPMAEITGRLAEVPKDRKVFVVCAHGNRSLAAAEWLAGGGYDAWSVSGGLAEWVDRGLPVEVGRA